MSAAKNSSSSNGTTTTQEADALPAELLMEENMENGNNVLQATVISGTGAPAVITNTVPEPNQTSSHGAALSFVSGPTFTAGSASSVALQATPATYIPVQVPGVIETAFTQTPAFATPVIYPSAFTTAYIAAPPAAVASPATPCTFLSAATPITAVCQCIYAQPCALHHRPITYTPHSFSSLGTVPAALSSGHSHTLPSSATTNIVAPAQAPPLPPTLALPPLRSTAMRLKRPNEHVATHPPSTEMENTANIRLQKMRRVEQLGAEATTSDLASQRLTEVRASEGGATMGSTGPSSNTVLCCDCRSRPTCMSCPCHHHHHHHICPRHPVCFCRRNESATNYRREADINPVHDILLSSRMAQIERQQQASNMWFHRQSLTPGSLVGVDVVARRITPHSLVIVPSQHQPIMELAMVLLQPHDPTIVLSSSGPTPAGEPIPVGATVEQINRFSTMYKYVKENNVPENEQERCTVCLNDFETDEEVRALRCNHVFHVICIDRWLVYNKKCPVCRLDLDKPNGESAMASS